MIPVAHKLIGPDNLGKWGFGQQFQARCSCRLWESSIEDNRPAAIRQHTVHVSQQQAAILL